MPGLRGRNRAAGVRPLFLQFRRRSLLASLRFSMPAVLMWTALVLALGWAGCAGPQPSRPLSSDSAAGPAQEAQERLFNLGRTHFTEHRYEEAVQVFRRLVEAYPQSPLRAEAHWWLGQAYEATGQWDAALAEYRTLVRSGPAGSAPDGRRWQEADGRIRELEGLRGTGPRTDGSVVGVLFPASHLPPAGELERWIQSLKRGGITTLLLEVGTGEWEPVRRTYEGGKPPAPGVFFRTRLAPTVREGFEEVVPIAHRYGLQVFASLTPRRMSWIDSRLGWHDWSLDYAGLQLQPSLYLDLFHPGLQEYLTGLLRDLVQTKIDGVLFRNDAPLGPRDGFSSFALRGFEKDFGKPLVPSRLFLRTKDDRNGSVYAPEFWRWAGWKAREQVKVLARLVHMMRRQVPEFQVALEIHPESVTDPIHALVYFSEDLLEAKRRGFELFLIGPSRNGSRPGRVVGETTVPSIPERLREMVGEGGAIWVSTPLPTRDVARLGERLTMDIERAAPAKGMGLIFLESSAAVP